MATEVEIIYTGKLHCELTHKDSGAMITTDAPKDNAGEGKQFSPTDLVGAALGSCILTTMGIYSRNTDIKLEGAKVNVVKHMVSEPVRRIGKLEVSVQMPAGIPQEKRAALDRVAHTCPVHKSLNPEIELIFDIGYPD